MKLILIILLLFSYAAKCQVISDTVVYVQTNGDTTKVVTYRNAGTTTTATPTRLKDSAAALRLEMNIALGLKQNAIGYTPYNATNPNGYISGVTSGNVTTALGYTPLNPANNLSEVTAATARSNLSLVIGTNVQAFNSNLTTFAGITPSSNVQALLGAADYSAFKTSLSLGNVTNESKATMFTSPAITGTPTGITATHVGLGNVDNTSDASKPVSTAQQTAINLKANIASPTFTGTVGGITAAMVGLGNVTNESKATMFTSPAFTGTSTGITATMVGLGNVTNTSDAAKPVSTAQQTAFDLKANLASPTFTGTVVLPNSTITNAMLAGSIAYSKLSLTGAILNADLAGSIDLTSKVTSILPAANGGTGVNNSTRNLTITTNGGTIVFPAASTTHTFANASSTVVGKVTQVDIAATASATATTTILTPSANGMYRLSIYMKITTTGTSPVAGPVTITYTEPDGSVAQSHVMLLQSVTGTVVTTTVNNSTTTGTVNGSMVFFAKSGVAIQYAIAVSGTFGSGRYMAHITLEAL